MLFRDRNDAALNLIPYLEKYKNEPSIVLAVPRGGVPIGFSIAQNYNLPLELLLTKKIGHPWSQELAIGAVSLEDYIIDERYSIPEFYIQDKIKNIREALKEQYQKFMGDQKPLDVKDKVVIIVDDGIATGYTLLSAIKMIRQKQPRKIVVAVPVAPIEAAAKIRRYVEDLICIYKLDHFIGVGLYYINFTQVEDETVIELLKKAKEFGKVTKTEVVK